MKAVLTCDDVFEVLTRAPFPAGGSDDEIVESHLAVCHECRQLAEALRPAIGLFHEAIPQDIDNELPAYRGELAPIAAMNGPLTTLATPHTRSASFPWWSAIAVCLAVVFISAIALLSNNDPRNSKELGETTAVPIADRDLPRSPSLGLLNPVL